MSLTTSRDEAGPVEMPHAPWPAQTYRPGTSGTVPISGRPSNDNGRAHARTRRGDASSSAGTKRTACFRIRGARAIGSGSPVINVEPTLTSSAVVTRLNNSSGGSPPSRPTSSSTDRGPSFRRTDTTTPQSCVIGGTVDQPGTRDGVHGRRHQDFARGNSTTRAQLHSSCSPAVQRDFSGAANLDRRPGRPGALRKCIGRRSRCNWVAGLEPAGHEIAGQRRLELVQLDRIEHPRSHIGRDLSDRRCASCDNV